MLGNANAMATIAVRDIAVARKFYEDKLGLVPAKSGEPGVAAYKSGDSTVIVYQSEYAGTNKATSATWAIHNDLEDLVETLQQRGVMFEYYDLPNVTRKGAIHMSAMTKAAWFKDPDGNIICICSESE